MFVQEFSPIIDLTVLTYFVALQSFYTVLIVLAFIEIARRRAERMPELDVALLMEQSTPPVTILVPAHNEGSSVVETVRGLLRLHYREVEILVINDGSEDDTLQRLIDAFDLQLAPRPIQRTLATAEVRAMYQSATHDNVWVIDKANGGKADSLNAGINAARAPILCCIDADTVVVRDALLRMVESFVRDPDQVIAVGGTVRVANGCEIHDGLVTSVGLPDSWLARFQQVEYLRAFVFGRLGLNRAGGNLIISGAFGLFLREAVVAVGGYDVKTVGEDMDLVIRLHQYAAENGGRVFQLCEPIAYTAVPESIRVLSRQRARWHRGLWESLWRNRGMVGRRRYGLIGFLVMPLFILFELLGPVVETLGYVWFFLAIAFGFIDPKFGVAFFCVAILWGMILSLTAVIADRWTFRPDERETAGIKIFLTVLLENFGYRQLTLLFRLRGFWQILRRSKSWGEMERKGDSSPNSLPGSGKTA